MSPEQRRSFRFWFGSIGSIFLAMSAGRSWTLLTGAHLDFITIFTLQLLWYGMVAVLSETRPPRY